jgi:hypothetical protein
LWIQKKVGTDFYSPFPFVVVLDPEGKKQDQGSRINIPDPQHWQILPLTNKKKEDHFILSITKNRNFYPYLVAFWAD